jgi:hypothetical protein
MSNRTTPIVATMGIFGDLIGQLDHLEIACASATDSSQTQEPVCVMVQV